MWTNEWRLVIQSFGKIGMGVERIDSKDGGALFLCVPSFPFTGTKSHRCPAHSKCMPARSLTHPPTHKQTDRRTDTEFLCDFYSQSCLHFIKPVVREQGLRRPLPFPVSSAKVGKVFRPLPVEGTRGGARTGGTGSWARPAGPPTPPAKRGVGPGERAEEPVQHA